MIYITPVDRDGTTERTTINRLPDKCPLCHNGIHPTIISSSKKLKNNSIQIIFRCPIHECDQLFIANYDYNCSHHGSATYSFSHAAPQKFLEISFDNVIKDTSKGFVDIYNQAAQAEARKCLQICGIGYRKALEFLIKDYLISTQPDKESEIRNTIKIGQCIEKFIDDPNIKECAKRAIWLGNDEAHYERKWENKDVNDLKRIITLTVRWIANDLETKKLLQEMPAGK